MPTYQYRCAKCGEQFELWQSIHDDSLTVHDGECGGALSKVMGAAGIVLKGAGFYRNDSRAKPPKEGKDESSKSKDKETAGTNGSGDKGSGDKGSGDKGSGDKGSGDKGSGDQKDKKKHAAAADSSTKSSKSGSSTS